MLGLKPVSQFSGRKIWKKFFSDFVVRSAGDNFTRCGRCEKLLSVQNARPPRSPSWLQANDRYVAHLREQECSRSEYYCSRALSHHYPEKVLSIMHDKMDHSKTASPCFANKTKVKERFAKLPLSISGILAHGHGDGKYAHFIVDKFPADCNQTIGSICQLLRDLEQEPVYRNTSRLFAGPRL